MLMPSTRMGRDGKYIVRRKLGQGGMAEVYLCSSRGPVGFEKNVAIKRIRPEWAGDAEFVEMFIKEAHLAANLSHQNVVHIYDFDQHDGAEFYVMEYVHGRSLSEVIRRSRELMVPIPHLLVAQIGDAVALGLDAAHRAQGKWGEPMNIVHRDVSPQNVLLSFDGVVKLTDFGVAKSRFTNTTTGSPKGKTSYMSPEQARGFPVDARTDLFALGIVIWEMLFRSRLFDGDSDEAIKRAVEFSNIPVPARVNPDVPEELSVLVMKTLERDPGLRFQTAEEMHRALKGFIARHAASAEEVELTGYLHQLFGQVMAQEIERDRSPIEVSSPAVAFETSPSQPITRSMKKGDGDTDPASPDEDMRAETHLLEQGSAPGQAPVGSLERALQQLVKGRSLHDSPLPTRPSRPHLQLFPSQPPLQEAQSEVIAPLQMNANPTALSVHPSHAPGPHPAQTATTSSERSIVAPTLPQARSNAWRAFLSSALLGGAMALVLVIVIDRGGAALAPALLSTATQESPVSPPLYEPPSTLQASPPTQTASPDTPAKTTPNHPLPIRPPVHEKHNDINIKTEHDKLIKQGRAALESEKASAAIIAFRRALKLAPGSVEAQAGLGVALINSGTGYKEAVPLLEQAVKADDSDAKAWLALGMGCQFSGDNTRAKEAYRKWLLLLPTSEVAGDVRAMLKELGQ